MSSKPTVRRLLCIETNYTYERIRTLGNESILTNRSLEGYFQSVWVVHPTSGGFYSDGGGTFGEDAVHHVDAHTTFVEGKIGATCRLSALPRVNFLLSQFRLMAALVKLVRTQRVGFVRANGALYCGLLAVIVARLCRRPLILRIGENTDALHGTTGTAVNPRIFGVRSIERVVEGFVLRQAQHLVAANPSYAEWIRRRGVKSPVTVIGYGSRVSGIHFLTPPNLDMTSRGLGTESTSAPYLLYVGRLVSVKHPEDCIEVLRRLRAQGAEVSLRLVGEGEQRKYLECLASDCGVGQYVEFLGECSQQRLSELNRSAAVVLCPLSGASLVEAACAGAPVVAYDTDWHSTIIRPGVTGELVPYRDVGAMASAAAEVLGSATYARSLGEQLATVVRREQDWCALVDKERRIYESMISDAK